MLRFYALSVFLLLGLSSRGQAFEKRFADNDHVDMVIVTPDMFSLINEVNENPERKNFYSQLTYFGTFRTADPQTGQKLLDFARDYVRRQNMRLLVKIKDPDRQAMLYYVPSDRPGIAREVVLMVRRPSGGKISVWHIKGHINLKKISLLAIQNTRIDADILRQAEKQAP